MANSNQGSVFSQAELLQRQFAQAPGLPFADLLPAEVIAKLLDEFGCTFNDRIYTPLVTLAMFLSQCTDADPSLNQAVARLIAQRITQQLPACSSNTGAYAQARQRLPEEILAALTRHTGKELMTQAPAGWRWHGRHVKIVAALLQLGHLEKRAKMAVTEHHVALIDAVVQTTEQRELAGLFALVRTTGGIEHRADGE